MLLGTGASDPGCIWRLAAKLAVTAGKNVPRCGGRMFSGHQQRGLRRFQIVIVGQRLRDQLVERLGVKQRPPVGRDIRALDEVLGLAAGDRRRGGAAVTGWGV